MVASAQRPSRLTVHARRAAGHAVGPGAGPASRRRAPGGVALTVAVAVSFVVAWGTIGCARGGAAAAEDVPSRYAIHDSAGRAGLMDPAGRVVVAPQFESVWGFHEGLAAAKVGGQWGFIDTNGRFVINPQYRGANFFAEGLAGVQDDNERWGFVDAKGTMVIPPQFEMVGGFAEGRAPVVVENRWGFIDRTGLVVIAPQFATAGRFAEGLATVQLGERWGFIDQAGTYVINPVHDEVGEFSEGLAPARKGAVWGFLDAEGKWAIVPQFEAAQGFASGRAAVKRGRWGYIDRTGRLVIAPQYGQAGPFRRGLAMVAADTTGARCGLINPSGHVVLPLAQPACGVWDGQLFDDYEFFERSGHGLEWASTYRGRDGRILWADPRPAAQAAEAPAAAPALFDAETTAEGGADLTMDTMPASDARRPSASEGTVHVVRMFGDDQGYRDEPRTLRIRENDTVEWQLASGGPHNIAFESNSLAPPQRVILRANMPRQSRPLSGAMLMFPRETYRVSFAGAPPGRYPYVCLPHYALGERGTIIVE